MGRGSAKGESTGSQGVSLRSSKALQPLPKTGIPALDFAGGLGVPKGIRELLLDRGVSYNRDDSVVDSKWDSLPSTAKGCFQNAATSVFDYPELTYVEGYAAPASMPGFFTEHAWLIDSDGILIDKTWADGTDYFGIPFDTDVVRKAALSSEMYGILSNLWCSQEIRELLDIDPRG